MRWSSTGGGKPGLFCFCFVPPSPLFSCILPLPRLEADECTFAFTNCVPCKKYTFVVRALTASKSGHSLPSAPVSVVCPGAQPPIVRRLPSAAVDEIHIGWSRPKVFGGAQVTQFVVSWQSGGEEHTATLDAQAAEHVLGPLQRGVLYHIEVMAKFRDGATSTSHPLVCQTAVPPSAPSIRCVLPQRGERLRLDAALRSLLRDRLLLQKALVKLRRKAQAQEISSHQMSTEFQVWVQCLRFYFILLVCDAHFRPRLLLCNRTSPSICGMWRRRRRIC